MISVFLLALLPQALGECGSLLTYRQHAALLESAPQCLRDGCQQSANATISSPCASPAPCSAYWDMFVQEFDQKHSWCSTCSSDTACRIHGWPVMNATAFCDTTPNQVLFGGEGCCIENDEPFELADWTGKFCNGTEWKIPFDSYGGMARLDWLEWIMPWNWTLRNDLISPDQQKCTAPSKYLSIYVGEHFFWLFFGVALGWLRLWRVKHEEQKQASVFRFYGLSIWTWFSRKYKQQDEDVWKQEVAHEGGELKLTLTQRLRWGFPVIVGVILAGLQLGFNFLAAWTIKKQPGYHDTPLVLLALLFCCRPRLSWLCGIVYALLSKERLAKWMGLRPNGDGRWAAKLVLSSVAVSSAVTEAIMQLLGAYFIIKTADVGRQRGFYTVHALRPKLHGKDARHMYLGALFWAIIFLPMLLFWFVIAYFQSRVNNIITGWRRSIYQALRPKVESLPKLPKGRVIWILNYIDPDPRPTPHTQSSQTTVPPTGHGGYTQVIPVYDSQVMPVNDSPYEQVMPYEGPGSSDLFSEGQPMPIRQSAVPRRAPYAPLSQSELDDQIMPITRDVSEGYRAPSNGYYAPGNVGPQRRTTSGNQYSTIPQDDRANDNYEQVLAVSRPHSNRPRPEMTQVRPGLGSDSHQSLLANTGRDQPPSTSGSGSTPRRSDITETVTWSWKNWEKKIIFAGSFFGLLAYGCQWLFWDGFVKAAGDRFCPPQFLQIGAMWWAGALLYFGIPMMGY